MTVIGFCLFSISFVVVIRYLSCILPSYNFGQFKWKIEGTPSLPSLPHFNHGGKKTRSGLSESIIDFFRGGRGGGRGVGYFSLCFAQDCSLSSVNVMCGGQTCPKVTMLDGSPMSDNFQNLECKKPAFNFITCLTCTRISWPLADSLLQYSILFQIKTCKYTKYTSTF